MKSQFTISKTHPSLAGHFPNNPIVPGAVILDEVINEINDKWPGKKVYKIKTVKFVKPLQAGQVVMLTINEISKAVMKFSCTYSNDVIVTGQCEVTDKVEI